MGTFSNQYTIECRNYPARLKKNRSLSKIWPIFASQRMEYLIGHSYILFLKLRDN